MLKEDVSGGGTPETNKHKLIEDSTLNNKNLSDKNNSPLTELPHKKESTEEPYNIQLKYPTKHLKGFRELKDGSSLFGKEYTLILKAVWYSILSNISSNSELKAGGIKTDNRIHLLIPLKSGKGKGNLKNILKQILSNAHQNVDEPVSIHPEQLVGKTIKRKGKEPIYEKIEGYLSRDYLIFDEGRSLLTSQDLIFSECRRYLRLAQDSFNTITKRPVDIPFEHELKYNSHVGTCIFTQPYHFNEDFVTDGDLRRYIIPYINMNKINRQKAYNNRIYSTINPKEQLNTFTDFLNSLDSYDSFEISSEFLPYFNEKHQLLVNRGFTHSIKINNFMEIYDFTLQDILLKMCAVQALQDKTNKINKKHICYAFMDLVEFTEHLYDFINCKILGYMDYGEGWAGAQGQERQILEWLYNTESRSEKNSTTTIIEYEHKIMEIFNVKERRAREIKQKHETRGWIKSKKAPGESKVWVLFEPSQSILAIPAIGAVPLEKKYHEIYKKLPQIETAPITPNAPKQKTPHTDYNMIPVDELQNRASTGDTEAQEHLENQLLTQVMMRR